jgi:hypothetical protein
MEFTPIVFDKSQDGSLTNVEDQEKIFHNLIQDGLLSYNGRYYATPVRQRETTLKDLLMSTFYHDSRQ